MPEIPTVRNLREARALAKLFPAVITAGPDLSEVRSFRHLNHAVETFWDVSHGEEGPTAEQVNRLLDFASLQDGPILVHCHAGISRSTATAIGVLIGRGWSPTEAIDNLRRVHPRRRAFMPNSAILRHIENRFGIDHLVDYCSAVYRSSAGHFPAAR